MRTDMVRHPFDGRSRMAASLPTAIDARTPGARGRRIPVVVLAFLLVATATQLVMAPAKAWGFLNQQIADEAARHAIGSTQGQCKVFAQNVVNVVLAANGISARVGGYGSPGGAYYGAYQQGGGVLVGINDAQPGDVIQTIRESQKNSDYPTLQGLHTAVVVGRTATAGTYVVRDSNWNRDEKVAQHNWAPATWAANRGAKAYVWRFGSVQPAQVNPGWVHVPGWASDVAMVGIAGGWEMFHIGGNGTIYRRKNQYGVATSWTAISGPRAKRIAVMSSSDGRAELFYIGMNDQIYHHWESTPGGDISRWEALGGYAKEITAARSGGNWEVFHVGGDNAIYRATQTNRAWQRMAGTWAHGIAAATSRDGRIELFHIAGGRNVMHAWQSAPGSSFSAWRNLGGWKTAIGGTSVGNGEYEVYAIGGGGSIWRSAPWSGVPGWQRLDGAATRISAARHPDGRTEVLVVNGAGNMYHSWQKRVGWF